MNIPTKVSRLIQNSSSHRPRAQRRATEALGFEDPYRGPVKVKIPKMDKTSEIAPAKNKNEKVTMCPDGDVLLIVGSYQKVSLLVASQVLSLASPAFKTKLSSSPVEGAVSVTRSSFLNSRTTYSSSDRPKIPVVLELPEDDPSAMTLLCDMLHFRYDRLPKPDTVTLRILRTLVEMSTKYNCAPVIAPFAKECLQLSINKAGINMPELLGVAYVLDDPRAFREASRQLVRCASNPFDKIAPESSHAIVKVARNVQVKSM